MESLKERDLADEYIYFDVESFHQFIEFILARTPRPLDDAGDVALEANQMLRNEMRIFDVCRPCSIQVCEYLSEKYEKSWSLIFKALYFRNWQCAGEIKYE